MNNLTVTVFTAKNDVNVKDCIESTKLLTKNVLLIYPNSTFVETVRDYGIKQAKTDWVLILDSDERISKELASEIKSLDLDQNKNTGGYYIPRKNIFGEEKWLKYGGWWPDYQTRLINKKLFANWPHRIHSTPNIKGEIKYLKNPLLHYFHGDLEKMVEKTIIFENVESDLLLKANRLANTPVFFRKFLAELWRRMFKNLGFLDGSIGVIESIYQAFSKTITYLFLYEKKSKNRPL